VEPKGKYKNGTQSEMLGNVTFQSDSDGRGGRLCTTGFLPAYLEGSRKPELWKSRVKHRRKVLMLKAPWPKVVDNYDPAAR